MAYPYRWACFPDRHWQAGKPDLARLIDSELNLKSNIGRSDVQQPKSILTLSLSQRQIALVANEIQQADIGSRQSNYTTGHNFPVIYGFLTHHRRLSARCL